ncbi:TadE/TadG family type IV pilus assembly protein [Kocuria sp. M1R5S2]|uniref:TadE/TadG family type IV pilus assembly protein n=1 Tax=Kocuria rhizosphaerae TaxID=3376285 RepID=UPI0037BB4033
MSRWRSERGAAAVEFALVLPILLTLVLGTIEFGRAYNVQISLTHAARETVRSMAISNNWPNAVSRGRAAAPSLVPADMQFSANPTNCTPGTMIQVTVKYPLNTITGIASSMTLSGKAAMRCGG